MARRVPVSRFASLLLGGLALASLAGPGRATSEAPDRDLVERGRYLVQVMDCGGCHDFGAFTAAPDPVRRLAGNFVGFGGPWGTVYPANLTSDGETGLGSWTDDQILFAVRHGRRPDGRQLAPAMPWASYSHLNDEDGRALVAYLRSLPPVKHRVPAPIAPGERAASPVLMVVEPD